MEEKKSQIAMTYSKNNNDDGNEKVVIRIC